jgi:hypothetical protein
MHSGALLWRRGNSAVGDDKLLAPCTYSSVDPVHQRVDVQAPLQTPRCSGTSTWMSRATGRAARARQRPRSTTAPPLPAAVRGLLRGCEVRPGSAMRAGSAAGPATQACGRTPMMPVSNVAAYSCSRSRRRGLRLGCFGTDVFAPRFRGERGQRARCPRRNRGAPAALALLCSPSRRREPRFAWPRRVFAGREEALGCAQCDSFIARRSRQPSRPKLAASGAVHRGSAVLPRGPGDAEIAGLPPMQSAMARGLTACNSRAIRFHSAERLRPAGSGHGASSEDERQPGLADTRAY